MKDSNKEHSSPIMRISLILSGIILILAAAIKIIKFVNGISAHETITSAQFALGVIIPHIALLSGLVLSAWGIILTIRHSIIKSRHS